MAHNSRQAAIIVQPVLLQSKNTNQGRNDTTNSLRKKLDSNRKERQLRRREGIKGKYREEQIWILIDASL